LAQLAATAQKREEQRRRQAEAAERQRVIVAKNEAKWAAHRAYMDSKMKAMEAVRSQARREYLRALNEDVMAWNVSPSELDYARYRIVDPARFRLFNH
jgi:hypothetical protein